ncbi:phage minor head protein [Pseudomonas sp. DE0157]|uniref:phage minor head protein n=1 Tax=Pseudomonas sp. DE0157 TaxID=2584952 RepID=UPI0011A32877|nr:phage minor head protein [Pseudomonas sp. DE0157]
MKASEVEAEIKRLEGEAKLAYLDQVAQTIRYISLAQLEQAVADNDEDRIAEIMSLGLLAVLLERLRAAYARGASKELLAIIIPGLRREIDMGERSVSDFLSTQAAALRDQVARDQMDAVRVVLSMGRDRGDSARTTALNLAGRLSRQTGRRTGGVVGLSGASAEAIERARDQLASGDPAQMRNYLTRVRRDPAFDAAVRDAIQEGKPLAKATIDRATTAYAQRLLSTYAEALAQTNTAEAYNKGREEGWQQLTARSNGQYTFAKKWKTTMDGRERNTHGAMNGQTVMAEQAFTSPSGAMLMFPCDTSLGAPLNERIRCRCVVEYSLRKTSQAV